MVRGAGDAPLTPHPPPTPFSELAPILRGDSMATEFGRMSIEDDTMRTRGGRLAVRRAGEGEGEGVRGRRCVRGKGGTSAPPLPVWH